MGKGKDRRTFSARGAARRYLKSLAGGRGAVRRDGDKEQQARMYEAAKAREARILTAVRLVIDLRGVSMCQRLTYVNFARHVDRLERNYSGRTLQVVARMAVDRWERFGLSRELLYNICLQVFNVSPLGALPGADGDAAQASAGL